MTKNLKFLHVCTKLTKEMKKSMSYVPMLPGMYNWINVFKGSVSPYKLCKDDLDKYDAIQINMSPVDFPMILEVARKLRNSSTMLVLNNDYVAEHWGALGINPTQYDEIQRMGDMVFGTEPYQTSCMIPGAYTLSHPHRTDILKHYRLDISAEDRKGKVGALYHWWEGKMLLQSILFKRLDEQGHKLDTNLYSFTPDGCESSHWTKVLFDNIHRGVDYTTFIKELMTLQLFVENCSYHTYGRTTVDTAALGVPTIGTNRVFSMRKCFPNMCYDPTDMKSALEIANKVLKGGEWLEEQMAIAKDKCDYFNYDNSRERFMKAYDESKVRVGK